eukprot:gnl/TRDRNA2_/TRDRNA2_45858_c0_seq1.p1 gnl/TRDRNA2_/TRDRNA2_45858_c0~~gnl/TRDRNA2_/TRDRNA2_45858_c0_seq1.p1  ORF type:complete len:338 (+),score=53.89 gnl/TRDRNA2_/TRDRNA2_45858_c0_seq1:85-1098(+)
MGDSETSHDDVVELNVGGSAYTTARSTLCRERGSALNSMLNGGWRFPRQYDRQGRIFIDRDGPSFRHVLNHLRGLEDCLPASAFELRLLVQEAEYYEIPKLKREAALAALRLAGGDLPQELQPQKAASRSCSRRSSRSGGGDRDKRKQANSPQRSRSSSRKKAEQRTRTRSKSHRRPRSRSRSHDRSRRPRSRRSHRAHLAPAAIQDKPPAENGHVRSRAHLAPAAGKEKDAGGGSGGGASGGGGGAELATVVEGTPLANGERTFQAEIHVAHDNQVLNHAGRPRTFCVRGPSRSTEAWAAEDARHLDEVAHQGARAVRAAATALHKARAGGGDEGY